MNILDRSLKPVSIIGFSIVNYQLSLNENLLYFKCVRYLNSIQVYKYPHLVARSWF